MRKRLPPQEQRGSSQEPVMLSPYRAYKRRDWVRFDDCRLVGQEPVNGTMSTDLATERRTPTLGRC